MDLRSAAPPARARLHQGFTLLEVLIALILAGLLVGVSARSLMAILSAEEHAMQAQRGALAVQTLACRFFLGDSRTGIAASVASEWATADAVVETTEPSTNTWQVWTLSPLDHPSLSIELFFRVDADGNL